MSTARNIIQGFAVAAQSIGNASDDPRVSIPARGAALILRTVARLLERRSPEEVERVLNRILADGAQPIGQAELDEQVDTILAELALDTPAR